MKVQLDRRPLSWEKSAGVTGVTIPKCIAHCNDACWEGATVFIPSFTPSQGAMS